MDVVALDTCRIQAIAVVGAALVIGLVGDHDDRFVLAPRQRRFLGQAKRRWRGQRWRGCAAQVHLSLGKQEPNTCSAAAANGTFGRTVSDWMRRIVSVP